MKNEKTRNLIEAVREMTEHEAGILEVFLAGFRAGKQASGKEREYEQTAARVG